MTHWQNSSKQHLTATPQSKSSHGGLRDQSLLGNTAVAAEMQHTSAMWTTTGNWQDIRKEGNEYNIIIDRIHYTQTSCPPDFNLAPLHCCRCTQIFCRHKDAKSFKFSRELPLSPTRQKPYDKSFFSRPTTSTESSWYCRAAGTVREKLPTIRQGHAISFHYCTLVIEKRQHFGVALEHRIYWALIKPSHLLNECCQSHTVWSKQGGQLLHESLQGGAAVARDCNCNEDDTAFSQTLIRSSSLHAMVWTIRVCTSRSLVENTELRMN